MWLVTLNSKDCALTLCQGRINEIVCVCTDRPCVSYYSVIFFSSSLCIHSFYRNLHSDENGNGQMGSPVHAMLHDDDEESVGKNSMA